MKWYGKIGYGRDSVTAPGVHKETFEERNYRGDLMRANRSWTDTNSINGNVAMSNQISILSDPYILSNFQDIRYAEFMGTKWKVTNVEIQYPRLILTLGGEYNG